jgi:hypothetical protein
MQKLKQIVGDTGMEWNGNETVAMKSGNAA